MAPCDNALVKIVSEETPIWWNMCAEVVKSLNPCKMAQKNTCIWVKARHFQCVAAPQRFPESPHTVEGQTMTTLTLHSRNILPYSCSSSETDFTAHVNDDSRTYKFTSTGTVWKQLDHMGHMYTNGKQEPATPVKCVLSVDKGTVTLWSVGIWDLHCWG